MRPITFFSYPLFLAISASGWTSECSSSPQNPNQASCQLQFFRCYFENNNPNISLESSGYLPAKQDFFYIVSAPGTTWDSNEKEQLQAACRGDIENFNIDEAFFVWAQEGSFAPGPSGTPYLNFFQGDPLPSSSSFDSFWSWFLPNNCQENPCSLETGIQQGSATFNCSDSGCSVSQSQGIPQAILNGWENWPPAKNSMFTAPCADYLTSESKSILMSGNPGQNVSGSFEFDSATFPGTACYMTMCEHTVEYADKTWALGFNSDCSPHINNVTGWHTESGGLGNVECTLERDGQGTLGLACANNPDWAQRGMYCSVFQTIPITDHCEHSEPSDSPVCNQCCCPTLQACCTIKNPNPPPGCQNINCPCECPIPPP